MHGNFSWYLRAPLALLVDEMKLGDVVLLTPWAALGDKRKCKCRTFFGLKFVVRVDIMRDRQRKIYRGKWRE